MTTLEIPFSQLIQQPKATMAKLESSPRRRLRLDRRDGEDLILESASRAEAEDEALSMASRLFFFLVKNDEGARLLLLSLADVFPWVRSWPRGRPLPRSTLTPGCSTRPQHRWTGLTSARSPGGDDRCAPSAST